MNTRITLESMVMDLKRVALGYYNGSPKVAKRFADEALKRKNEIDFSSVKPYIRNLLEKMEAKLNQVDSKKIAEDSLLLSIIFQNYTQVFLKK